MPPRDVLSTCSFSQLSITRYRAEMHRPVMARNSDQVIGSTNTACKSVIADPVDASAAKVRICPTRLTSPAPQMIPPINPA